MSSIPLVANSIKPPEDPLQKYAQIVQLKSLLQAQQQEQQLAPLRVQQQQQATQEGAMNLAQRGAINSAYHDALSVDPNTGTPSIDEDKLTKSLAQNNQGSAIPGIMEGLTKWKQANATLQESQQKIQTAAKDSLGLLGSTLQQAKYDPNLADLLIEQKLRTPGLAPQEAQQLQGVRQQIQQNPAMIKQLADSWVAQSPQQQTLGNAREVARIRSNTVENQQMNDWLAKNPDKTASDYPAAKASGIATAEIPGKVAQATAVANAELPIKVNQATQETNARIGAENSPQAIQGAVSKATAVQKALASQSNAALADVPPHLVAPAAAAATKAGEDFAQAQQAADDMKSMIDLAKSGNKVAYAYSPVTGVLQINVAGQTKRINTAEIEQYGGAGSALDRLKGYFGKQATGASIPDNILKDMQGVSSSFGNNAKTTYQRKLDVVNQNYGSKFTAPGESPSSPASKSSEKDPLGIR